MIYCQSHGQSWVRPQVLPVSCHPRLFWELRCLEDGREGWPGKEAGVWLGEGEAIGR